jgi:2-keto-4-pentenoate hydratase
MGQGREGRQREDRIVSTSHRDATALTEALVAARLHHAQLTSADWQHALQDAADAYAVQDGVAAALHWFGNASPRYWKSGGPSLGALTHAPLPPAAVRTSPASFADLPLHAPAIEAEIALRLSVDIDAARAARLSANDVDSIVDAMTVSIELVDSRWREGMQGAPALLRLADLASHAGLVLGDWVPFARRPWSAQRCEVRIGARPVVVQTGTHSLGDPAAVLPQWLQHATRGAATLPAGTVVTTGTWAGALPAQRGDEVVVSFDGIGSASLRL